MKGKVLLFKLVGIKEESYQSHINCLSIKRDQIPSPTSEKREVKKIPVTCRRIWATHWPGWLIVRWLYHRLEGPKSLLTKERCLELYPLPRDIVVPARLVGSKSIVYHGNDD